MNSGQDSKQELSGGTLGSLSFSLTLVSRSQGSSGLSSPPVELSLVPGPGWELLWEHVFMEVSLTWAEVMAVLKGPGCFPQQRPLVFADCAGCKEEIKHGQSLLALDKQWHVSCFKCQTCSVILTGEYISKWVSPLPPGPGHPPWARLPHWPSPASLASSPFISNQLPHHGLRQHLTHPGPPTVFPLPEMPVSLLHMLLPFPPVTGATLSSYHLLPPLVPHYWPS